MDSNIELEVYIVNYIKKAQAVVLIKWCASELNACEFYLSWNI